MNNSFPILNDELLWIVRAQAEPHAFGAIYDHYFPRIYNYARYRVQSPVDADDLTAQIFERALVHLKSYRPDSAPFSAWLFGIARNAINDYYRRQHDDLSFELVHDQLADEPPPESAAAQRETRDRLLTALMRLSDRERDLLALKFAADLTHKQIAQIAEMSESSVSVTIFRALKHLRSTLKEEAHERT